MKKAIKLKKKLFIFGLGSLTGSKLAILAKKYFEIIGTFNLRDPEFSFAKTFKLDITDYESLKKILTKTQPDLVVNMCAINNVDYCERNKTIAKKINSDFVEELSKICNSLDAKLVQTSSDSVFDGAKNVPYTEVDKPKPINYYGFTKMLSENSTLQNPKNLVIRVSILYGWLIKSLLEKPSSSLKPLNYGAWLIEKLKAKEKVTIIKDEYSSPIIADDLANSILHLIQKDVSGIFHSAPKIRIIRYDFSVQLANYLCLDSDLIFPVTSRQLGRSVNTGLNKCLDSSKIVNETGYEFMSLEESFKLLKKQVECK